MIQAYQIYGVENAKVLYIVEDEAWNLHDQRYSEVFLANKGVLSLRKTFEQLLLEATFDDKGRFFVDGDEICLVYFRWGYSPNHYYNEKIWELRENIELSKAIKCPNIKLILVNFKKIQLELQKQQVMDKFLEDQNQQKQINHQFAKILELPEEEQEYQNLISDLEINFHKWVLKPNREGGGNNLYGTEIIQKLKEINKNDKKDYILMEKISQRPRIGHMLTHEDLKVCGAVSELSTWGAFISESKNNIDYNIQGGYLNRTKNFLSNEGGLAVGMSVLDGLLIKKDEE
ncbi:hypothetical protein PPERSA_05927 [Pseudocohnilembus persalinus]|uniref:Glutathione synthase substrate-binding domain-containing protein n=1 Tax=Pseudocohnilembus persalinus TaxID=266149 RepID=A0A0V0R4D6_PSEPJ|nr:hypothetical protein PPERSA_05927 [Pseudocohnilembus persalinus]|eukprot:KRX09258.1 hypothetical protein PPERSA_05927 [Pseudocohnilembus persalinus]